MQFILLNVNPFTVCAPATHLSPDWLSLTVDDCIRSNDAVGRGISLYHLELHSTHASSDEENITFTR